MFVQQKFLTRKILFPLFPVSNFHFGISRRIATLLCSNSFTSCTICHFSPSDHPDPIFGLPQLSALACGSKLLIYHTLLVLSTYLLHCFRIASQPRWQKLFQFLIKTTQKAISLPSRPKSTFCISKLLFVSR